MTLKYTRITSWQESEKELRAIRHEVFVVSQNCPPDEEWDEFDANAVHFLVKDAEDNVYATARLIRDENSPRKARIGRFAVYPQYRRQGIARQLVKYVISFARSQQIFELELSAQVQVKELYLNLGFKTTSEEFIEAGIPHIKMNLTLGTLKPESAKKLGEDTQVYRFTDHKGYLDQLIHLASQARQSLIILSHSLDRTTLDHPEMLEAISALARKSRSTFVRIVIQDCATAVAESSQLLKLTRRLTTSIEIKILDPEINFPNQVYLLADNKGLILRHSHENWSGFCCYSDPGTVKRLNEEFNRLLIHAHTSPELSNISI